MMYPEKNEPLAPALIVGVNGQDGQILAKHLANLGYPVIGVGRQADSASAVRPWLNGYRSIEMGLEIDAFAHFLEYLKPGSVFYLAAVHGPSNVELDDKWLDLQRTIVVGLHQTLDYARRNPSVQIVNFSSSRVFGRHLQGVISEVTPRAPEDMYGVMKVNADSLVAYYREQLSVNCTSLILFNHESELRREGFFSSKLIRHFVDHFKEGRSNQSFTRLDFWNDWGHADEFMSLVASGFPRFERSAYILATGTTSPMPEIVTELATHLNLRSSDLFDEKFDLTNRRKIASPWTADNSLFEADVGEVPVITGTETFLALLKEALE